MRFPQVDGRPECQEPPTGPPTRPWVIMAILFTTIAQIEPGVIG